MTCYNLVTVHNIPENVTNMSSTFSFCDSMVGNIYIQSNQVTNAVDCFNMCNGVKNVYISFTYSNGVNTSTYNTFTSAGYNTEGSGWFNVYLKDINANTVPVAINISSNTGDITIAGNTYTTNGTYNIPIGEQTVTVAGTASTQFYLSSGSGVQLAALGVNTCTLNFVSSSQVTTSYSGSPINVSLPLSLIWWNKDK